MAQNAGSKVPELVPTQEIKLTPSGVKVRYLSESDYAKRRARAHTPRVSETTFAGEKRIRIATPTRPVKGIQGEEALRFSQPVASGVPAPYEAPIFLDDLIEDVEDKIVAPPSLKKPLPVPTPAPAIKPLIVEAPVKPTPPAKPLLVIEKEKPKTPVATSSAKPAPIKPKSQAPEPKPLIVTVPKPEGSKKNAAPEPFKSEASKVEMVEKVTTPGKLPWYKESIPRALTLLPWLDKESKEAKIEEVEEIPLESPTEEPVVEMKQEVAEAEVVSEPAPEPTEQPVASDEPKTTPLSGLSQETLSILNLIPKGLDTPTTYSESDNMSLTRASKRGKKSPVDGETVERMEDFGISIEVKTPPKNINAELERAYQALIIGQQDVAIRIYNDVLKVDSENELALFGLATTYHKAGEFQVARSLYGKLLELDPDNRETLNNFLLLVSEESPEAAILEFQKLELQNPDFSPVPALMANVYLKLGDNNKAYEKMLRAVILEPENTLYRYNLAIILDKLGRYEEAALAYRKLIKLHNDGYSIPTSPDTLRDRIIFLQTNHLR
jgi:tetratricopeptide (TPR) repeat protein